MSTSRSLALSGRLFISSSPLVPVLPALASPHHLREPNAIVVAVNEIWDIYINRMCNARDFHRESYELPTNQERSRPHTSSEFLCPFSVRESLSSTSSSPTSVSPFDLSPLHYVTRNIQRDRLFVPFCIPFCYFLHFETRIIGLLFQYFMNF